MEDSLEEGVATHSNILAWRIPWTEEPGKLQSIGLQRVGHDWSNLARMHSFYFFPLLIGNFLILSTSSVPTHALPALFTEYIFGTNIWNYSVNLSPSHQRFIISLPRCLVTPNSSSPIEMGAGNTSTAASHKIVRVLLLFPPTPSHSQLLGFAELALYTLSCIA